ncbi:Rha family transcriptional regulator [Candidatus Pseudoruminococcus sp.]|uniref:Rha family transcriptional regulator n=1 Tax=Candidatus Pseudoruminococcus sp. TaxID=3101048 RepID=UPI00399BC56C
MLVKITGKKNEEVLTTTSRDVAEVFGKEHKNVLRDIETLQCSEDFRKLNFEPTSYTDSWNRKQKEYIMTRDGFTLLVMGYTGEKAMQFKEAYIKAFNEMEKELKRIYAERQQWEIERAKGVLVRHILTDTIKLKVADSPHKRFMYPNYTKMIYKALFGKTLKELQEEVGVKPKESIRDYLTSEQLKDVESMEMLVSSLINCGWGYEQIKEFIHQNSVKKLAS